MVVGAARSAWWIAVAMLTAVGVACHTLSPPNNPPPAGWGGPESEPAWGGRAISDGGRIAGRLYPESGGAIEIGRFQTWVVELRDTAGAPVAGADLAIAGGMPGHGHGLPTEARVTAELGNGRYRIEGLKLNMVGAWV